MAGRFADNFGWYSDPSILYTVTENGTISTGPYGRGGGPGVRFSGNADDELIAEPLDAPSGATAIVETDFRVSAYPASATPILRIFDGEDVQGSLDINSDGTLEAFRDTGGSKTSLGSASTYEVPTGRHIRIGLKYEIDAGSPAGGAVTVFVFDAGDTEPQEVLTLTGVQTQATGNASWTRFSIKAAGTGTTDYGNLVAKDGSGGSPAVNADLDTVPRAVHALRPNAAGSHSGFTRSSGVQQHATVDDSTPDNDLSYNRTGEPEGSPADPVVDTLHFQNVPSPDEPMAFAVLALVAKGAAATDERLAHVERQTDGTLVYGTELELTTGYKAYLRAFNTMPNGQGFAPDEGAGEVANAKAATFNAHEFGYAWPTA